MIRKSIHPYRRLTPGCSSASSLLCRPRPFHRHACFSITFITCLPGNVEAPSYRNQEHGNNRCIGPELGSGLRLLLPRVPDPWQLAMGSGFFTDFVDIDVAIHDSDGLVVVGVGHWSRHFERAGLGCTIGCSAFRKWNSAECSVTELVILNLASLEVNDPQKAMTKSRSRSSVLVLELLEDLNFKCKQMSWDIQIEEGKMR